MSTVTSVIDRIDAALDMAHGIVETTTPGQLQAPSFCPGWNVRFELNHLVGGMHIFAAELTGTDAGADHHADWLGTDHRAAFTTAAALDRAAWHRPDALDTTVRLGFGAVPGPTAALVHLTEILVHSADLAVLNGREDLVDQRQCADLLATMRAMDFDAFRRPGMFAAEQRAPADAAAHRRLLAFTGRDLEAAARPVSGNGPRPHAG
ncbi:TIGR03086 family metal-binding protein [Streptomyces sp. NPDC001843]|uniref:TIGR03086 family metal-binding protein n=1 Tax=Streptomyces sp. NPDC001843 TaxID=3364617 RepID=UPI0036802359